MKQDRISKQDRNGPDKQDPLIQLRGIHKSFQQNHVLRGLDLDIFRGKTVAVLGGSGSGKSVLLKIIIGLLQADQGIVRVFGTDATRLKDRGWEPLRSRTGMLFQASALFDSMTVEENVAFPLREHRLPPRQVRQLVDERLEWVQLPGIGGQLPSSLSGGMRKRVALARTIATDPELILYDEPTTGLDPLTGRKISELIRSVNERLHSTSIVVTHDLICARIVADRWTFMGGGRIIADGTPEELRKGGPPEVLEFIESTASFPEKGNEAKNLG